MHPSSWYGFLVALRYNLHLHCPWKPQHSLLCYHVGPCCDACDREMEAVRAYVYEADERARNITAERETIA